MPAPAPWNVAPVAAAAPVAARARPVTVLGRSSGAGPPRSPAPPDKARPSPPPPPVRTRGRGRRWSWRTIALLVAAVVVFVPTSLFLFGWWQFSRIPTVDVSAALSPAVGGGTNYLIVGTDSREGIDPDDPNAGAFLDEGVAGLAHRHDHGAARRRGHDVAALGSPRSLGHRSGDGGEGPDQLHVRRRPGQPHHRGRAAGHPREPLHGDQLRQLRRSGRCDRRHRHRRARPGA